MADEELAVAPTDVAGEHNLVRRPLRPFATWQLEDAHFAFDSSVLLPSMTPELVSLIGLVRASPGARLSVFGHADTSGADEYNKGLAGRRAVALYALLTRRTDLWEQLFTHPHGGDDWGRDGGFALRLMRQAVDDARATLARPALFQKYMGTLARDASGAEFGLPARSFLARGADRGLKGDVQGCGEFNPLMVFSAGEATAFAAPGRKAERDEVQAINRRVTVFFFSADTEVQLAKWPCPRTNEGVAGCRARFWSDHAARRTPGPRRREQPGDPDTFACRFYDRLGREAPEPGHVQVILHHATRGGRGARTREGVKAVASAPVGPTLVATSKGVSVPIAPKSSVEAGGDVHHEFDLAAATPFISLEAQLARGVTRLGAPLGFDLVGLLVPATAADRLRRTLGFLKLDPPAPTPAPEVSPVDVDFPDLDRPFDNPIVPEGRSPEDPDIPGG